MTVISIIMCIKKGIKICHQERSWWLQGYEELEWILSIDAKNFLWHGLQTVSRIYIVVKNCLHAMIKKSQVISFNKYHFGRNHCLFDLRMLKIILEDIITDAQDWSLYNLMCENNEACVLLKNITLFLESSYIENVVPPRT